MDKEEAKRLYICENKNIKEIAKLLKISEATVYRWKREGEENNEDWDERRSIYNLSPTELEKVYLESVKELVLKIKEDPGLMLDPRIADAMSKHISNLKKMNPRQLYIGAAFDLLNVIDEYLKKNDLILRNELVKHYEEIKNELKAYIENKL
jgi:transposase-like protein